MSSDAAATGNGGGEDNNSTVKHPFVSFTTVKNVSSTDDRGNNEPMS
jgi:hypothetical protein